MRMSPNRLARLALAAAVVFGALPASAQQDPFALPAGFLTQAAFSCGNVTVSGGAVVTSAGAGGEVGGGSESGLEVVWGVRIGRGLGVGQGVRITGSSDGWGWAREGPGRFSHG